MHLTCDAGTFAQIGEYGTDINPWFDLAFHCAGALPDTTNSPQTGQTGSPSADSCATDQVLKLPARAPVPRLRTWPLRDIDLAHPSICSSLELARHCTTATPRLIYVLEYGQGAQSEYWR